MSEARVALVEADQCMYGLKTTGEHNKTQVPANKPTKLMTNSRALGQELSRRCDGKHEHQYLVDGRARVASRCLRECARQYAEASSNSKEKCTRPSES